MNRERDTYFDAWRGVAILMVVAVHTYVVSFPVMTDWGVLVRNVCNVCVPLFIGISGYFYARNASEATYKEFLLKQLKYVYLPTVIWSLPFFAMDVSGHGITLRSVLLLCCCGYSIYYFIAIIFQFYLLAPVLKPGRVTLIASVVVSLVSIAAITYFIPVKELHLRLIVYASPFVIWVVFWCLGAYCSRHAIRLPLIVLFVLVVLGLALSQYETSLLYPLHRTGFGFKPSSHLLAFAMLCVVFSGKSRSVYDGMNPRYTSWLSYLGRSSFGIYLIHMHVARHLLRHLPYCWIVRFLCLLAATLLVVELLKLVLRGKARYIGVR